MRKQTAPTLSAISGVGSKGPACFLLETGARRFLLDLGYGPDPGRLPDVDSIGEVDALILSHGHRDHAGALQLLPKIGNPPIYATEIVAGRLQSGGVTRMLPLSGSSEILGIPIVTGRNGHAPGGIWIWFAIGGGFVYMGDYSPESLLYAADVPPRAATIVIDASNGDDDSSLAQQAERLAASLDEGPVLLPVPADGRGPEIALHLGRQRRFDLRLDAALRESLRRMIEGESASLRSGVIPELAEIADAAAQIDGPQGVILATPADGSRGETSRLIAQWEHTPSPAITFTGYVPPGTPADRLVGGGRARIMRWNVHPRLSDNVTLVRSTGAASIIPAFCEPQHHAALVQALAPAAVTMNDVVAL
jgi:Cft2 family RNA processing exonuclease